MNTGTRTEAPTMNGSLGATIDALREELGMSVTDLADRTPFDEAELYATLAGEVPAPDGHQPTCLRALADVIEHMAASHG